MDTNLLPLGAAYANASAPAIELQNNFSHEMRNQVLSYSHNNTREASSASPARQKECERTLRQEELKVPDSELCNICMANSIDCLILECGHMATCLACAKSLSMCPICRKQISRIVKAFKS